MTHVTPPIVDQLYDNVPTLKNGIGMPTLAKGSVPRRTALKNEFKIRNSEKQDKIIGSTLADMFERVVSRPRRTKKERIKWDMIHVWARRGRGRGKTRASAPG